MALDVEKFFPKKLREVGLYDQVLYAVAEIVRVAEEDLKDSVEKWYDFQALPEDLLLAIIQEFGYDYITDVLDLDEARIRQLSQLISLIHFMKGHKDGLILVLDLLGFVGSIVTEWWEKSPQGTPDTFDLELNLNISSIDSAAVPRLLVFIENYVYPIIESLTFVSDVVEAEIYMHGTTDVKHYGTIVETL